MKTILRNERGFTLAIVLMMMVVLLSITGAGLLFSSLNVKASANLKGGTAALQAADAGIQHALAATPAGGDFDSFWTGTGLANFPCKNSSGTTGTCNGTTYKPTLTGSINGYSYTVVVENDTTVVNETATNDVNKIVMLTSTAKGSNGSNRTVRAYIGRSTWTPPGAIYLPGNPTNVPTHLNGNSFAVKGVDTNLDGTAGPLASILGIATNNDLETTAIKGVGGTGGTLTSSQYGQVTGQGSNPSVATVPTTVFSSADVDQLVTDLLNKYPSDVQTYTGGSATYSSADGDLGTISSPKITRITGTGTATLKCGSGDKSNTYGYGVLIVDKDVAFNGLFNFKGLMIIRGEQQKFTGTTNKVSGAILVKESTNASGSQDGLTVSGNLTIQYSSQALKIATDKWPNAFSTKARIVAWNEMM